MGENDIFKTILLVVKFNTFVLLCNVFSCLIFSPSQVIFAVNSFIDFYSVLCLQARSSLIVG